jgi:hypothetical protein
MKDSDDIDLSELYTPLEEAKEEIWERWNNASLRKKVANFLGDNIPGPFQDSPKAVLSRNIRTPNFESYHFLKKSKQVGLTPLFGEFTADKFCTKNREKLFLAKIPIIMGRNKAGSTIIQYYRVVDLPKSEGTPLDSMVTLWEENFVSFHHRIYESLYGNGDVTTFDFWSCLKGNCPLEKYEQTFALFTCHGILFENYLTYGRNHKYEHAFTRNVIWPAFHKVHEMLGVKPLQVRLLDEESEDNLSWQYYPSDIKGFLPTGS